LFLNISCNANKNPPKKNKTKQFAIVLFKKINKKNIRVAFINIKKILNNFAKQ
jgi:hypothetical protein